jgi:tetratricopeptide (TPR) repeat protein
MVKKILILVSIAIVGCGIWGTKRAPIDKLPSDLSAEDRIEALEGMKEKYPNDPNLYLALGRLYYDQFLPVDARNNFEKALAIDPKLNEARVSLAVLYLETDETDSAKALLDEALKMDPKDSRALTKMGIVYYSEKDVAKAVYYFTRAIQSDPKCVEARYNLGLAFAEAGLLSEAEAEWRKILEIAPDSETADQARMALERVSRVKSR